MMDIVKISSQSNFENETFGGNGLYAGSALYANVGRGLYASAQRDILGRCSCDMKGNGNKIPSRHLKSRPEDANFHRLGADL